MGLVLNAGSWGPILASMAEAEFAFIAAAGAASLALAVSAWSMRLRRKAAEANDLLAQRLGATEARLAARDSAFSAFEDVRLEVSGETLQGGSSPAVLGSAPAIAQVEKVMFGDGPTGDLFAAVASSSVSVRERLDALIARGEPCDLTIETTHGALHVEGRAIGGSAWLRLAPEAAVVRDVPVEPLVDNSPTPTWLVDREGALVWANQAWLAEMGADSVEAAREAKLGFDRNIEAVVGEARRTGELQDSFRWTTLGGRRRAWRIVAQPVASATRGFNRSGLIAAFAIDATEAEETRDTLRRHVEGHDETLNHLADAVAIFGPSKRLAFHNTAFQQLFTLDPAWLDERPTHSELLDRLRQRRQLPEMRDYGAWKAAELDFYGASEASPDDSWSLPDGRTLRVVRQPHPLGGVLLLFSDITRELELRARYNAQLQVQTATLDKLNDAVAVFGSDGRLRLHNEAFETFWRVSADQLAMAADFDAVAELCRPVIPDESLWLGLKARVADPDPQSRVPISGEGRTADRRVAAWQTRPLPDGATLVAFSDVTARRELETALAQREAALAESQLLKREFVGSVSYELRTPLTTIVGYSELLEAQPGLPDRSRQHAGAIRVAASQLTRSIDDVLDMAQIDAGEMQLTLGDMRIDDLLNDCAERVRPKVEGRDATLTVRCPEDIRTVRADVRRISQALDHLLDNAARSVGEGGEVTLSAQAGPSDIRVSVSDTGRGIPYHLQAHVFDRFVRRDRGGPGLALALVKALVELHGGWAEVESEPGKGATFILHLPFEALPDAAAPELSLG